MAHGRREQAVKNRSQGRALVHVHPQANSTPVRAQQHFTESIDVGGGGNFDASAHLAVHGSQKTHVGFLNHRVGIECSSCEETRGPRPPGQYRERVEAAAERGSLVIGIGSERSAQDHGRFIRRLYDYSHGLCEHDFPIDALLQVVSAIVEGRRLGLNPVQGV